MPAVAGDGVLAQAVREASFAQRVGERAPGGPAVGEADGGQVEVGNQQDDPADVGDLLGVLRVKVKLESAWGCGQRGDGEDLVGSPALVPLVGDEVGAGEVASEGGLGIVRAFFVSCSLAQRRFLHGAGGHVLEPVVLDAAEVAEHSRYCPAGRHDRRLPGILSIRESSLFTLLTL
jgi:hypothetical protein